MTSIDVTNLQSINENLKNYETADGLSTNYESGFRDLMNVHNIYIHSFNIEHYGNISVRCENIIIKKVPVSSSLGYVSNS